MAHAGRVGQAEAGPLLCADQAHQSGQENLGIYCPTGVETRVRRFGHDLLAPVPTNVLQELPISDRVQPGVETTLAAPTRQFPVGLQKCFLSQIVGGGMVAG